MRLRLALFSAVDRRLTFFASPKKVSKERRPPRSRRAEGPVPCAAHPAGRLRNSPFGLRQSSPTTPGRAALLGALEGGEAVAAARSEGVFKEIESGSAPRIRRTCRICRSAKRSVSRQSRLHRHGPCRLTRCALNRPTPGRPICQRFSPSAPSANAKTQNPSPFSPHPHLPLSTPPSSAGAPGAFGEDCLSPKGEFRSRPARRAAQQRGEKRGRRPAVSRGRLFFAYFLLAKQKKVRRRPGEMQRLQIPENRNARAPSGPYNFPHRRISLSLASKQIQAAAISSKPASASQRNRCTQNKHPLP